jgi:hypothetical protein
MSMASTQIRFCAVSMELAAYLDGHYVEMHILTDTGKTISIVCEKDSIFSVQRHIEKMGRDCPEIATWKTATNIKALHGNVHRSYEPAPSERRHGSPRGTRPMFAGAAEANRTELQK